MPIDFSQLKKHSSLEQIKNLIKKDYKDNRYWKPTFDSKGCSSSIIRFLPSPPNEDSSIVKIYSHSFKGRNGWYIENCPTTIGEKCPCCEFSIKLWNQGDAGRELVRQRKRKEQYIANILVIQDKNNPEAEGKVFLYKFGVKIFEKILSAINAPIKEDSIDVFNFWEGADFILVSESNSSAGTISYVNYDKSYFRKPSVVQNMNDDEIEKLWRSEYSLKEELKFKPYYELKERFDYVVGNVSEQKMDEIIEEEDIDNDDEDFDNLDVEDLPF